MTLRRRNMKRNMKRTPPSRLPGKINPFWSSIQRFFIGGRLEITRSIFTIKKRLFVCLQSCQHCHQLQKSLRNTCSKMSFDMKKTWRKIKWESFVPADARGRRDASTRVCAGTVSADERSRADSGIRTVQVLPRRRSGVEVFASSTF